MDTKVTAPTYRIWGAHHTASEPMELPALVSLIKEGRVKADTWLFLEPDGLWEKASQAPELKMFFQPKSTATLKSGPPGSDLNKIGIKPGSLRRIKIFADMEEPQLEAFLQFMEIERYKQFAPVVRKGEHGEAMYLVLEGELRALTMIDGKESTLSTMTAGEFFGEISLLDHGPRSADVIANQDSLLLKISAAAFEKVVREAPELAVPFLFALSRSVVGRIRKLTKRYEDSIHFSRTAGVIH